MLARTDARGYRGGGGGGRGGGRGGYRGRGAGGYGSRNGEFAGAGNWGGNTGDAAAVWGGGAASGNGSGSATDGYYSEPNNAAPVGRSMTDADLTQWLKDNNGQNYARLKELTGCLISGGGGRLSIYVRAVQSDPFAPGSQLTVRLAYNSAQYHHNKEVRRVAFEDLVMRHVHRVVSLDPLIEMMRPSQHVVERSTVRCVDDAIEIHLRAKMPGQGRRIDGRAIASIVQRLMAAAFGVDNLRSPDIFRHLDTVEDQEWLRGQLAAKGLVAFIPDGAILPRSSGASDTPLMHNSVSFTSPESFKVSFKLPCRGTTITGMGIAKGVTVVVGGGFHGKSTLLRALEVGVYNKIPGDGREYTVVDPTAVKIRSEDRRAITGVDISPFINNIPFGRSTSAFTTKDASGSTSQAANIVEAVSLGATALLIDEDTSATNFMARDAVMRQLVPDGVEPITPLVERVRGLYDAHGVSTILVAGGSSAFIAAADHVIHMSSYAPKDLTAQAKALALASPSSALASSSPAAVPSYNTARPIDWAESLSALAAHRPKCFGASDAVRIGDETIDLSKVEQIVEGGQCNGVAMALAWAQRNANDAERLGTSSATIDAALKAMSEQHLEVPGTAYYAARGFVAMPRRYEVGAALNRLRTLAIKSLL